MPLRMRGTRTSVVFLTSLALLALIVSPAKADTTSFDLTVGNAGAIANFTGPYVNVFINRTDSTHATITFTALTAILGNPACTALTPCTYLMGDGSAVALNVNGTVGVSGISWTGGNTKTSFTPGGAQNVNSFRNFNFTLIDFDGFGAAVTSVTFTLTRTVGAWVDVFDVLTPNGTILSSTAAAHIFVQSASCSGACATGFASNGAEEPPSSGVPEPGRITLLGTGLLAIAFGIRRRWFPSV